MALFRGFNYFIAATRDHNAPGTCPVVLAMIKFFSRNGLSLEQIFYICSGKRMAILSLLLDKGYTYADPEFEMANDLFERNFAGIIREYQMLSITPITSMEAREDPECPVQNDEIDSQLLAEYFNSTDDDETEKVLIRSDDADEMLESFYEIAERMQLAALRSDPDEVRAIADIIVKISSLLLHYSPYLDTLASSLSDLALNMKLHCGSFIEALRDGNDGLLKLFDAVNADMERYIQRFMVESLAMKNTHHIHEPTSLSIRQIIVMFVAQSQAENDIEFF